MKVLQLGKFFPIRGGVEKVMFALTTGLAGRGIECDMLCAAYTGKSHTLDVRKNQHIICCRTWFRAAGTMISPGLVFKAMRMCRHYDIVHIHHPDPMACLALWCARYKGKVILHWHSDIIKQKRLLKFYLPLQRWLLRRADLVLTTSPVYIDDSPYLQTVKEKVQCLPIGILGIPSRSQKEEEFHTQYAGKKVIFSLGRLVPYKGFDNLIRAARFLPDDYVVLIGGSGPLKHDLEAVIKAQHLEDRVKLLGRISDDDMRAYYHICKLFCLPSVQKTEAFGIVQIEAMSCGKPVVATNIKGSGVPWVNEHGVSGLNVPIKDPKALAEAILEITSDDDTYRRYSQNALERFNSVFQKSKMIDRVVELYNDILNQ